MSDLRIHPRHVRMCGLCMPGIRDWVRFHNLDWREFVKEGIRADVLIAIGDPTALRVVETAKQEAQNHG